MREKERERVSEREGERERVKRAFRKRHVSMKLVDHPYMKIVHVCYSLFYEKLA